MPPKLSLEQRRAALATGVTRAALAHILDIVYPDATAGELQWSVNSAIAQPGMEKTLLLEQKRGEPFKWLIMNIHAYVTSLLQQDSQWREMWRSAMAAHHSTAQSPWRFILYLDEITPGNVLDPDTSRKLTCFHFSFLELSKFVRSTSAWIPIAVLRHSVAKNTKGGMSAIVRALLRDVFIGPLSLQQAGIAVDGAILYARLHRVIGDSVALQSALDFKGHAGTHPCLNCKNVVSLDTADKPSLVRSDTTGYLVDIACTDSSRLDPARDEDIWSQ